MHTKLSRKRYWLTLACVWALALAFAFAWLAYDNPMQFGSRKFWLIAQRRADALIAMAIVVLLATILLLRITGFLPHPSWALSHCM